MKHALVGLVLLAGCTTESHLVVTDAGTTDGAVSDSGLPPSDAGDAGRTDAGPTPILCDEPPICGGGVCNAFVDDQQVFALPSMTDDLPTITLDEHGDLSILVPASSPSGAAAFLVRRVGGVWSSSGITPSTVTGALATGAPGPLVLAANDGAFGNTLYTEPGGPAAPLGVVPTEATVRAGGLVRGTDDSLHLLGEAGTARDGYAGPTYVRRDPSGVFETTRLPAAPIGVRGGAITVDGDDNAWIAWRVRTESPDFDTLKVWSAAGGVETAEDVVAVNTTSKSLHLAAAGSMIWAAYVQASSFLIARRDGSGIWPMLTWAENSEPGCDSASPCVGLVPLGLVADCDGTASAFFVRNVGTFRVEKFASIELLDSTGARGLGYLPTSYIAVIGGTVVRDAAGDVHIAYLVEDQLRNRFVRYGRWTVAP